MKIQKSGFAAGGGYSIFLAGDCYLGSSFWNEQPHSTNLKRDVRSTDLAITNLEAPLKSDTPAAKYGSNLYTSEEKVAIIRDAGFDAVSLANNHVMDFGVDGLTSTIEGCEDVGLAPFGAGHTEHDAFEPFRTTLGTQSVAVLGVSEHEGNLAEGENPGAAWIRSGELRERLRAVAEAHDLTVLIAHGGLEYVPLPPSSWRRQLRDLATTGVDAIIAHHPHTPQGWEVYRGVPIFYSLGNYLMYKEKWPSTWWSYGVELVVRDGEIQDVNVILFSVRNGRLCHLTGEKGQTNWEYLVRTSEIIQRDESYPAYWQEIAHRLYRHGGYRYQYHRSFMKYGSGHLLSGVYDPIDELDRVTRGVVGSDARREKQLAVRDYIMNASHRDAIQTAIGLETGAIEDERTSQVQSELDELFETADGRPDRSFLQRQEERLKTVISRIIN